MNSRYPRVAQRAAHHCEYCGAPETVFNFAFEVEHIVPAVCRGLDEEFNWALSCRSCNLHKYIHVEGFDPEMRTSAKLFNPRRPLCQRSVLSVTLALAELRCDPG